MTLVKRLISSGIWQTLEVVALVIAQFLYLAVMARILTKPDFGLMAIANSFVALGSIFAESGMGAAIIQRKNMTNKHINAALQGGMLLGVILFLIFFSFAPLIAKFFEQTELEDLIKVIAINFLILSISAVSLGVLQKGFKFKEKSIVTIFSVIISYTIGVVCGINGFGVWSLVIATLLFSILKTIGYFFFARIKFLKGIFLKEWKELFSFGFGMILLKINGYIGSSGINLVLGKIFTPGLLGVFERTSTIKNLPSLYIGNILDTIMFPAMSEIQDEKEKLFKIYQFSLGVVNTILMPVSLFLIFFSKEIVLILLGKNWTEAIIPLQIMFVVLTFSSSGRMADSVVRAKGLIYKNAFRKFLYVIVLLISTTYGGYKFGLIGAAVGVTISSLFNYITMLFLVRNIFKKSIIEIFLFPILAGLKLTLILVLMLVFVTTILNLWNTVSIIYFLALSSIIGAIVVILIWKKPSFFGEYLNGVISILKNRPSLHLKNQEND